jgi:hypothetical protein
MTVAAEPVHAEFEETAQLITKASMLRVVAEAKLAN